jgi:phosphoenolpyruvate carboxykinase (ATP)
MDLKLTRNIIDAIHDDSLAQVPTVTSDIFGLQIPTSCPGVPTEILQPKNTWSNAVRKEKKIISQNYPFKNKE